MSNMFARSQAGLNLTPEERALLRLLKSFLIVGGLALLPLLVQLEQNVLTDGVSGINWEQEAGLLLMAFIVALVQAIIKYVAAQGDQPLADMLTPLATALQQREPAHGASPYVEPPSPDTIAASNLWAAPTPDPHATQQVRVPQDMPNISAI